MDRYEKILGNINSGVAVVSEGNSIVWSNSAIETLFSDFAVNGQSILENILSSCRENATDFSSEDIDNRAENESTIWFSHKDFQHALRVKQIPLDASGAGDELIIIDDVTEYELVKKDLYESMSRFDEVAENAQVFIWEVDSEGLYVYASPAVKNILGYTPKEMVGKKYFYDFFAPETRDNMKAVAFDTFAQQKPFQEFKAEYYRKDGMRVFLSTSGVPIIDDEWNLVGYRGSDTDITDRVTAEEALKLSHERYRTLFEGAAEGIVLVDLDKMEIEHCNSAFKEMFGYSECVPGGKRVSEFHPPEAWARLSEEYVMSEGESKKFISDAPCLKKDGGVFHANVSISMVSIAGKDYFVCFFTDITGLKRAEFELEKLGVAIEQSANMVVITDRDGVIRMANRAFTEVTGYSPCEAIGEKPSILKSGRQTQNFYENLWDTIRRGETWQGKMLNKKKDGSLYWEKNVITPIRNEEGLIVNFIAIKEDITDMINAEAERESLLLEMEKKNRELETLSYGISHDMKAPLVTIEGYCGFLEDDGGEHISEICRDHLGTIKMAAGKLRNLIDEFMEYSKLGRMPLKIEKTNLGKVMEHVRGSIHPRSVFDGITLEIHNADAEFFADGNRIAQVFENLIGNSIRYIGADNANPKIEVGFEGEKNHGSFYVRDNGIGVAPENTGKLFDMFFQVSKSTSSAGNGVGLAIVKKIIDLHSGNIWVESAPGAGTTMYFSLP